MLADNVSANAKPTPPAWVWFDNNTLPAHSLDEAQEKTQVRFAFWIMAVINVSFNLQGTNSGSGPLPQ